MVRDDILENINNMTQNGFKSGVKKPTLQEIYAQYQSQNQKEPTWTEVIAENLPNIAKIASAAFIKDPYQQGAIQQSLSEEQTRQEALRQAYRQAQQQKQKDFLQIAKEQMEQEQEGQRYEQEKGFKESQAKTQAEQFAQELELKKAKQAEDLATKQRELALKQLELDQKGKEEKLTPSEKKYEEARGAAKAKAQTDYEESLANFEPLEKQLMEAIELVPNTVTGPLSAIELTGRRYGLGSKDKLANTARLQTIINKQVLAGLQNFKGAISDKEREFLEKMVGGGAGATAKEIQSRLNTVLENLRNDVKSKQKAFERFNDKPKTKKDSLGIL